MKKFLENKYARLIIGASAVILGIIFMALTAPKPPANSNVPTIETNADANVTTNTNNATNANVPKAVIKKPAPKPVDFAEKKTPHFVSANVANNATLTQMPGAITLTFDAPLVSSTQSFLSVKKDDTVSVTRGQSYIDSEHKTLSVNLNQTVTSGDYYVYYVACFANVNCKDGRFGFHLKLP